MDAIIPLIIMLALYLLPELLKKKRNPDEYEYPEIPDRVPPPEIKIPEIKTKEKTAAKPPDLPPQIIVPPPVTAVSTAGAVIASPETLHTFMAESNAPSSVEQDSYTCQGRFDGTAIVNGVIFAEILLPPKALRNKRRS